MSVDHRCRLHRDAVDLEVDELLDDRLPSNIADHGDLAGRGARYRALPSLGIDLGDRCFTIEVGDGPLRLREGLETAGVVVALDVDALSDVVQDRQSPMGLAMTSRVQVTTGSLDDWIGWEPVLRALCEGRPVHESGAVEVAVDVDRRFGLDDDPAEMAAFLVEAGFLHVTGVFDPVEMGRIGADIDASIAAARDGDPGYWWCTDATGTEVAVRSLDFQEKSAAVRAALGDERLAWIADLTGDGHVAPSTCEGLVKPLDIVTGLSDLPWHKDCGQGLHSYKCNSLTVGISVTGADRVSGALGVVPGSHRANTTASMRDPRLDLPSRLLETTTGDLTIHCSDTLHRAYPPTRHPRQVVYTSFVLPPLPGDEIAPNPRYSRAARSELTDVQERIAEADNPAADTPYDPAAAIVD